MTAEDKATAQAFDHQEMLATMPAAPGVYRMLGEKGELLYVGKAKHLKKRVASYFVSGRNSLRIRKMVAQIRDIQITVTETEAEALLLESNLIKQHRPRYNILLRDDKSYPYIYVSTDSAYPRLSFHRGARSGKGRYFGPYPSATAVRFTLSQLQKLFKVRLCEDSYYRNRSRPCLQYQIKRCSAPCVDLVSQEEYRRDIEDSMRFLSGKSDELIDEQIVKMERASAALEFEQAAQYRDQIELMRKIAQQQYISGAKGDVDVIAVAIEQGVACVQVFYIRTGNSLGNRAFFPRLPDKGADENEVLAAFLGQYYAAREIPAEVIISRPLQDHVLIEQMLRLRKDGKVVLKSNVRGERSKWLEMAERNARVALRSRLASRETVRKRYEDLQERLGLDEMPKRMECFDISHTQGEATVASCVVFNEEGPLNGDYRRFNITGITPGDDYAAMHQALTRRYRRLAEGEGVLPDILFIDGGRGQLHQAEAVLSDFQIQGVTLVGVAKGEGRKAGLETLFVSGQEKGISLPPDSPALQLVLQIRDEAHRFAITGHRKRRAKARVSSTLEEVPGLGPKRRQALLQHFGGIRAIATASIEELAKVQGISRRLAETIYGSYHDEI